MWAVTTHDEDSSMTNSNLRWFDPVDDEGLEETLQALERGGVDTVLEAVRRILKLGRLKIFDVGFCVVTHSSDEYIIPVHSEDKEDIFNLIIPLFRAENKSSEQGNCIAPVGLGANSGLLLSGDTYHGLEHCDYRAERGLGVAVSVHLANDSASPIVPGDAATLVG